MTAESIAKALGGRKVGGGWMARCPAHADREPSLSIRHAQDGKILVRCHAGCDQAQLIAVLRSRGLWECRHHNPCWQKHQYSASFRKGIDDSIHAEHRKSALAIWRSSVLTRGTLVEKYFVSRGLHVPSALRLGFHAGLKHPSGTVWPAMVALVSRGTDDAPVAIHRTFLARDGSGKAPVDPQKMMLGPCSGGAVRLAPPGDLLMVGEGIETCIAAMQATNHPAWVALSASGLRVLELPTDVRELVVLADGDDPGEAAARDAALRWSCEGRRVRIARPPRSFDFNDVLLGRTTPIVGGRHVAA
jgi:putative DNA primase/helicase